MVNDITVSPRSNDPFDIVSYYIKWATTSLTYSMFAIPLEIYPFVNKLFTAMVLLAEANSEIGAQGDLGYMICVRYWFRYSVYLFNSRVY